MSFQNPANRIYRRSVVGMEGMHSKMFDPPTEGPVTPEFIDLRTLPVLINGVQVRANPVPEIMLAVGALTKVSNPHTVQRQLMHGMTVPTWDARQLMFFVFRDPDGIDNGTVISNPKNGAYPAPTIRVPRQAIYHCETSGSGPPPHTIHWHGQEPTPMNDGVGHCSMELGGYIYQWQPNFMGSYFYHCHRNTVQHFEFGLYGFTIIDPPDAFFSSIASIDNKGIVVLNNIPVGNSRPEPGFPLGFRRCAANLDPAINAYFARFGQSAAERVPLTTPDPAGQFLTDPHAYTVRYDVEALWVLDDRDINWSQMAPDARATFPVSGTIPGVNDNFHTNADPNKTVGAKEFFAFNDYRSSHWFVTGVPVPALRGNTAAIPPGLLIPPELMSGVGGLPGGGADPLRQVQISINAVRGQNILLRCLNAAYNNVRAKFPVDIVLIAWDGRALGVPPFASYNAPVLVPKNTWFQWSVARRFDAMIHVLPSEPAVNGVATVQFLDTRGLTLRATAQIPIVIA